LKNNGITGASIESNRDFKIRIRLGENILAGYEAN
jgi:hypothetical protein